MTIAAPRPSQTAFHDHATVRRRLRGPATVSSAVTATSAAGMVTAPCPPRYTENDCWSAGIPKCVMSQTATWVATRPSTAASTASAACRSSRRSSSSPSARIGATIVMSPSSTATGMKTSRRTNDAKPCTSSVTPVVVPWAYTARMHTAAMPTADIPSATRSAGWCTRAVGVSTMRTPWSPREECSVPAGPGGPARQGPDMSASLGGDERRASR